MSNKHLTALLKPLKKKDEKIPTLKAELLALFYGWHHHSPIAPPQSHLQEKEDEITDTSNLEDNEDGTYDEVVEAMLKCATEEV